MYDGVYDRGIAVGESNIERETMTFRFRDEVFEFPTFKVYPHVVYNGYWYEAPIDKLRELEREAATPS
jgi:hypothetical protein